MGHLVEIREPSLAAPVAAVVGVGYRAPRFPHCLADSGVRLIPPQDPVAASRPSTPTGGGWAARLFGDRTRSSLGGRHANSDAGDGVTLAMARRESEPDARCDVTLLDNVRTAAFSYL